MYLYHFSSQPRSDNIMLLTDTQSSGKAGDLLQNGNDYYLVLGEEIAFPELHGTLHPQSASFSLVEKSLLSEPTLQLLHDMVYQRYSSYKTVIKLFLDKEVVNLLKKKPSKKEKNKKAECHIGPQHISSEKGQTLIVFPDLRTRENYLHQTQNTLQLNALDTQAKKNLNRWKIKNGSESLIIATGSEIFQDFQKLESIYLVEPQKWYYASQQDPRYKAQSVLEKMAELYGAELHFIESDQLL